MRSELFFVFRGFPTILQEVRAQHGAIVRRRSAFLPSRMFPQMPDACR